MASVSAFVTTRIWNLDQGFDVYYDEIAQQQGDRWAQERFAESVMDDLLDWWKNERDPKKPSFLWAHLYDPHHPHVTHSKATRALKIPTMLRLPIWMIKLIDCINKYLRMHPIPSGS